MEIKSPKKLDSFPAAMFVSHPQERPVFLKHISLLGFTGVISCRMTSSVFGGVSHSLSCSFVMWKWNCECPDPKNGGTCAHRRHSVCSLWLLAPPPPNSRPLEHGQQIGLVLRAQEPVACTVRGRAQSKESGGAFQPERKFL